MHELKFRGIKATDGREVFGTGAYKTAGFECVVSNMIYVHCKDGTVSQKIATDKFGNEVYEGDEVRPAHVLSKSMNFFATMYDLRAIENGELILEEKS